MGQHVAIGIATERSVATRLKDLPDQPLPTAQPQPSAASVGAASSPHVPPINPAAQWQLKPLLRAGWISMYWNCDGTQCIHPAPSSRTHVKALGCAAASAQRPPFWHGELAQHPPMHSCCSAAAQAACPRAGWVSMLRLEWLRKQCSHPARTHRVRGCVGRVAAPNDGELCAEDAGPLLEEADAEPGGSACCDWNGYRSSVATRLKVDLSRSQSISARQSLKIPAICYKSTNNEKMLQIEGLIADLAGSSHARPSPLLWPESPHRAA